MLNALGVTRTFFYTHRTSDVFSPNVDSPPKELVVGVMGVDPSGTLSSVELEGVRGAGARLVSARV